MLYRIVFILLVFIPISTFSQEYIDDAEFDTEGLMLDQFVIIGKDTTFSAKEKASVEISKILGAHLAKSESFDETFELKHLGKISSADKKLNIYTWNFQKPDFTYRYGGVVQYRSSLEAKPIVFELKHTLTKIPHDKTDHNNWYGCLYYKIIENQNAEVVTYTVFGWDGYNSIVTRKIIDVITVNRNGAYIGKPIFYMEKGRMNRMLFQYNSRTVMMLDYEENNKRIVFDHLSPSDPQEKGNFKLYGPDSTYDALEFKKGKWYLKKDIDLRLGKDEQKFGKPKKIKKIKPPKQKKSKD